MSHIIFNDGSKYQVMSGSLSINFDGGISKCSLTYLNSPGLLGGSAIGMTSGSNPFNFNGKVIGSSKTVKSGQATTTITMVDGSYVLDQKSIVLFRRTRSGGGPSKMKTVTRRLLRTRISYNPLSVEFEWSDVTKQVVGCEGGSCDLSGNFVILGQEDYNPNPCAVPSASYEISEGAAAIGAGMSSSMRVNYEGTFRSVLSSLCNDVAKRWRWNPFGNGGLEIIDASNASGGVPGPSDGCGIISYTVGETLEGTFSQESIVYWSDVPFQSTTASKTIEDWQSTIVPFQLPNGHGVSDLTQTLLYSAVPSLKTYDLIMQNRWEDMGTKVVATLSFDLYKDQDWCANLRQKFNLKDNVPLTKALAMRFGVATLPSSFWVVQPYPEGAKAYDKKLAEEAKYGNNAGAYLYYPCEFYNQVSYGSSSSFYKKVTVTIDPEPQLVLKNGKLLRGYFESVDVSTYGDTDATEFSDAVSNCIKGGGGGQDLFGAAMEWILAMGENTIMNIGGGPNTFMADPEVGNHIVQKAKYEEPTESEQSMADALLSLPADVRRIYSWLNDYGCSISYYTPPGEIGWAPGGAYQDPRELSIPLQDRVIQTVKGMDGSNFKDVCKNIEDSVFEQIANDALAQENAQKPRDRPPTGKVYAPIQSDIAYGSPKDGGMAEQGDIYTVSCKGKSITVKIGGLLPYRFVTNYSLEYSAALESGSPVPTFKYASNGGRSGGLERTVLLTDISGDSYDDSNDTEISGYAPGGVSFPGPVQMAAFETTGFTMQITDSIRSISASFSDGVLRVNYEYQTYPPKPNKVFYKRRVPTLTRVTKS